VVEVYREPGWIQAQTPGSRDVLVFEEGGPRPGERGGIAHFGFRLVDPADIEAAGSAVRAAGGKILGQGEFCPGEPYVFFTDPRRIRSGDLARAAHAGRSARGLAAAHAFSPGCW
jgi:catechol 2,3-dioxygenase-like lactoylglutathione lyase family enzyme